MAESKTIAKTATPRAVKVTRDRLRLAQFERNVYVLYVENTTTLSDILKPIFWTHIAAGLNRKDRIEVEPEDGSWFAEFRVVSKASNWAKVVPLRIIQLDGEAVAPTALEEYYVKWASQALKYQVHRRADKAVVASKLDTSEQAMEWIANKQSGNEKALEAR